MARQSTGDELLSLLELGISTTGNIFYVDSGSGSATAAGDASDYPLATIDQAIGKCTASQGDVIIVLPGHAEAVVAASGITCDVAGVRIVGVGDRTSRPVVTISTATSATIVMSAAGVSFENISFVNTIDALAVAFPVTAASCGFYGCSFTDDGTDNTITWFTLSADADQFECHGCVNKGTDTAGNTSFLTGAAADQVSIRGLLSNGDFSAANIDMSAAWTDCVIEECRLQNSNAVDVCIEGFSAATGWVSRNYMFIATAGQLTAINTVGALSLAENYQVNTGGETGALVGTVSG
jgi:hypothetical protein